MKNKDYIEIKFEYKNQSIVIKAEPFRTLDYICENAIIKMNKIILIQNNIKFYYLGKELNLKNSDKIGNIFNHKEKVTIKLKNQSENENKLIIPKNNIINKKNNIYLLNSRKLIFPKISEEIKLPLIKKISGNKEKDKDKEENSEKEIIKEENKIENPCSCERLSISEYCRNCRKFICIKCKSEIKHKNHLTLNLNMINISENVKHYGKILQDDIQKKIDINRNIFTQNEVLDEAMIINRKQIIYQKYKIGVANYKNTLNKIISKLSLENKEKTSIKINAYNDYSKNIIKQLKDIEKKLQKNYINENKKITFNDLRAFFDEINSKEESLNFFGKEVTKYQLKEEINTKMISSLDKIERLLNELCNEDSPFNLDNKYLQELSKLDIIKINQEKKENLKQKSQDKENTNENDNNININTIDLNLNEQ
mgnify:CR=1 FL=1